MTKLTEHSLPSSFFILQQAQGFSPKSSRSWARDIKKTYENKCFITGLGPHTGHALHAHHLFNKKEFPEKSLCLLNGILLTHSMHKLFHQLYGQSATPTQFIMFIKYLQPKRPDLTLEKVEVMVNWVEFLRFHTLNLNSKKVEGGDF